MSKPITNKHSREMYVAEIWRYPIKSLAGEQIDAAEINADGIAGDRRILVYNEKTRRIMTSRTHSKLLGLKATISSDGIPLINGHPWEAEESAQAVISAAGSNARIIEYDGLERFDILPLLVATDGAIEAFGYDRRRLRPNIVIGGVEGLAERDWPGHQMRIGKAVIEFAQLRGRCVMTTYDPDTQEQDHAVLRYIVKEFDGTLALDTDVIQGGHIAVGDMVEFVEEFEDKIVLDKRSA